MSDTRKIDDADLVEVNGAGEDVIDFAPAESDKFTLPRTPKPIEEGGSGDNRGELENEGGGSADPGAFGR